MKLPTITRIFAFAFAFANPIACVVNDNSRQDSYMNAYMEFQSTSELPLGVVYPESAHTYGPPQPRPLPPPYYGPPAPYPPSLPPPHIYPAEHHFPLLESMLHLPSKLEFVPKLITAFLEITKILLKVVLLKIVLKFVVMFCLFFFLPKLDMLDMMTDMSTKPSQSMAAVATAASNNNTAAADSSSEEQDDMRLNRMTNFVLDSINGRSFLSKYCEETDNNGSLKCKLFTMLTKLDRYAVIPKSISRIVNEWYSPKTAVPM